MILKQRAEEFAKEIEEGVSGVTKSDLEICILVYLIAAREWAEKGFKAARERPSKWDDPPDVYSTFKDWWKEVEGE